MPRQKVPKVGTVPVERVPGMDDMTNLAWSQLRESLKEAIASGALEKEAGAEHVAILKTLLVGGEGDRVGRLVFEAGFFCAMSTVRASMEMMVEMVPHECSHPGHAHGPADTRRIGRA